MANIFLKECEVKKANHYEALTVWKFLEVSKHLYLYKDKDKEDDKECVSLYYKVIDTDGEKNDDSFNQRFLHNIFKIGNLSEEDAIPIDKFLQARQAKTKEDETNDDEKLLFECLISKCDKKADEDKRFSVAIFIKGTEDNKANVNSNKDQKENEGRDKDSLTK